MDAKEIIGRAVAKVKGEEYHGAIKGEVFVCACGFQADAFRLWTRHEVDYVRDYTSEANIREAVRLLLRDDPQFKKVTIFKLALIDDWSSGDVRRNDFAMFCVTVPAETLIKALLPIAQEILEQPTGAGGEDE